MHKRHAHTHVETVKTVSLFKKKWMREKSEDPTVEFPHYISVFASLPFHQADEDSR